MLTPESLFDGACQSLRGKGLPTDISRYHPFLFDEHASKVLRSVDFDLAKEMRPFSMPPCATFAIQWFGTSHPHVILLRDEDRPLRVITATEVSTSAYKFVIGRMPDKKREDGLKVMMDAACLLLNQPRKGVSLSERPAVTKFQNGRLLPFMRKSIVKIDLDFDVRSLRPKVLNPGSGRPLGWHQVRGHYYHHGGSKFCTHSWHHEELDDEGKSHRSRCPLCDRVRSWRTYPDGHGSALHGFIQQKHLITHSGVE